MVVAVAAARIGRRGLRREGDNARPSLRAQRSNQGRPRPALDCFAVLAMAGLMRFPQIIATVQGTIDIQGFEADRPDFRSRYPPVRRPGLDPGPRFCRQKEEAGPRIKSGMPKEGR
ncbi:hypothetical protein SPHINGO8AM_130069 [Sphingomonas sp. 8AM]|nr:hypothetical protein SPHINGO8AM_130069 [Sphingomonas sp. 8AM]